MVKTAKTSKIPIPSPSTSAGCVFLDHTLLQIALRLILGGIFLQSGLAKLAQISLFVQAVQNYHLLTNTVSLFYAHALPWLEVLCGVYLLLGLFLPYAAILTGALLASFLVAVGWALVNGQSIDCGCFIGGKQEPISWWLFSRDCLMLAGCVALFKSTNRRFSLDACLSGSDS